MKTHSPAKITELCKCGVARTARDQVVLVEGFVYCNGYCAMKHGPIKQGLKVNEAFRPPALPPPSPSRSSIPNFEERADYDA